MFWLAPWCLFWPAEATFTFKKMFFSILKWGKCDTERAEALLNNCQPVWLLQGELTRTQMLTHFFLAVSTRGHCYNTLDILLVYPRLLLQEMSLKMSRNVCVWLWPFLISPDKEHQAFCFLMTSVAFLYPPCCTIYKPDTKHDKKKKEKKKWTRTMKNGSASTVFLIFKF